MAETTYIYALFDDATHNLFYVGHTSDLGTRFRSHTFTTARECRDTCYIEVLEEGENLTVEDEFFWITYMSSIGCQLKNTFSMSKAGNPKRSTGMLLDFGKIATRMELMGDMAVEDLARKAFCTAQTIYNIKKGRSCNKQTAKLLAKALKCRVADLEPEVSNG